MSGTPRDSAQATHRGEILAGISEFGEVLAELVRETPGARGAVLSDSRDLIVDSARDPAAISELDLYIAGAQIGQAALRLDIGATIHGLGRPIVVVESDAQALLATRVLHEFLLTLLLARQGNIARAMHAFESCSVRLAALLR